MIKYLDLKSVTAQYGSEISEAVQRVVDRDDDKALGPREAEERHDCE